MPAAIEVLRADRDALVEIARPLSNDRWESPSGCDGWTTKDLISHMASLFWSMVDASALPDTSDLGVEQASAAKVDARRSMTPTEVPSYAGMGVATLDSAASVTCLGPSPTSQSHPEAMALSPGMQVRFLDERSSGASGR
jgi:uncharacterized protein (TIGR03083 family)